MLNRHDPQVKMVFRGAIFTLCFAAVAGQSIEPGQCPDVEVMTNFDMKKYYGRWYQYSTYVNIYEQGRCAFSDYSDNKNVTMGVHESSINIHTGAWQFATGYAWSAGDFKVAKLFVTFPDFGGAVRDYWILGTDYESYAVVWSCRSDGTNSRQYAWIITRDRAPSDLVLAKAMLVVHENGLKRDFVVNDQANCPKKEVTYMYHTSPSVILTMALKHLLACLALAAVANAQFYGHGDCPDVEVEHDFDWSKYAGIWYQYSYISPLEKGKCDTHEYIDNGNGTYTLKEFTIE
ncbi:Hypothetical predicted protein [Cloeon dipterum]|uniref:Lipocalin/cytosolic fatty-acid binding domain-containing protein n=1 Tax=Cloeon dipterum TaxID=197152 RepID=A0A8S1DPC7_9INSE|nr:Hypothetical predicted protein [Cloeon dipterum]